ncbi:MAG: energy transducer TonB [Nitrospirae bacterium]|nr:energy transducer TonB [Nitrospirota bacterium]
MEIKRTLILSLLLHITFSALLLLSVRLQGDGGKMLNDKVFFVDLKSDVEEPTASVEKDASFKKTVAKKIQKEPAVIIEKRDHDEEIILKDSVSDNREANITESLSIDSEDTTGIAKSSDKTFSYERMEYANSAQSGEEIILSDNTADDKRGGLTKTDVLSLISTAIERAKTYPEIARRRSFEGTAYVSFFIGAEGEPSEIKVIKSSGYKMLDEATLRVVKKAAPYPYIENRVEIPVTYRLED